MMIAVRIASSRSPGDTIDVRPSSRGSGSWRLTGMTVNRQLPEPRDEGRTSIVSPGDLDEAIRTAIIIGDLGANDNVLGSPFEKIEAFSDGVLEGLDACGT